MKVIYRLCDIRASNPSPIFYEDKVVLNLHCLKSFGKAFQDLQPRVHFIADHCKHDYDEDIQKLVPWAEYEIEKTNTGINENFLLAARRALEADDDIFIQECDYEFQADIGISLHNAIQRYGLVSHYDHPDKYPGETELEIFDSRHWRTAISTTTTFGVKKDLFKKHYNLFVAHGYLDHIKFVELREKAGIKLWTPIPSMATHMVSDWIAPNVEWSFS